MLLRRLGRGAGVGTAAGVLMEPVVCGSGSWFRRSVILAICVRAEVASVSTFAFSAAISLLSLPIDCSSACRSRRAVVSIGGVLRRLIASAPITAPMAAAVATDAASTAWCRCRAFIRRRHGVGLGVIFSADSGALGAGAALTSPTGDSGGDSTLGSSVSASMPDFGALALFSMSSAMSRSAKECSRSGNHVRLPIGYRLDGEAIFGRQRLERDGRPRADMLDDLGGGERTETRRGAVILPV